MKSNSSQACLRDINSPVNAAYYTEQTFAQMCINGHISCCSSKALVFSVRYMFLGFRINVLLGQSKVYYVDDVFFLISLPANEKILWLDISINEIL